MHGNLSDFSIADCGVPNASHLGPLLFIIFIIDVGDVIKTSKFQVYADDIKIYFRIKTLVDQVESQKQQFEARFLKMLSINFL